MIQVVNIIPQTLSGETNQDSEPNIAVNPADPLKIAASAFTPNPMGGSNAPIYVSVDGGNTWSLNNIVPSAGSIGTGDITLKFAGTSSRLFTSILDGSSFAFEVHRTVDFTSSTPMTQLETRGNEDQPYVQASTVMGGPDAGKDRVFIGVNDFNATGGKTATIEQTLDGAPVSPVFSSIRLEKRTTLGQNGPQVRPAIHPDGTIYAAFYRWITSTGSFSANTLVITNAELIVVRDDNWGQGTSPFTALTDPSDSLSGRRVATGLSFPFNQTGVAANGQERWGGDISIAVDPRNSATVYVAYSTLVSGTYTLQLVRSVNRGVNWSGVLLSISNARNPALAINSLGKIGFAYQQFTGSGTTQRWETHFRDSTDGLTWTDSILCTALSQVPVRTFSPYIGDYMHMMSAGKDFYGIFSANNTPDLANFPQGVTYQRNHSFTTKKLFALDGVTEVAPSIDPFFFKVTEFDVNVKSDFYVRDWTNSAADHDNGIEPSVNPYFYVNSDVWNQRTNAAPSFVNDQPQNQDPQNNATNFAFTRVSRNNAVSAETVHVDFFVAEFGTGSPYNLVASTTVSFGASDTSKIASASWTLPPTTSTHLCLAAQISTVNDPFVAPGLNGNTPGWPTTDTMVINDNNKAQRNMSVHYGLSGSGASHFAIIRNASKEVRDFQLRILIDDRVIRSLSKPMIIARNGEPVPFQSGSIITVKGLNPGEYSWVGLQMNAFKAAKAGMSLPIDFQELVNGTVVNGFRINIVSATPAQATLNHLLQIRSVFLRYEAELKAVEATAIIKQTNALLRVRRLPTATYLKYARGIAEPATAVAKRFLELAGTDPALDIAGSIELFTKASAGKDMISAFSAATTLVNKLDIALTLFQKLKHPIKIVRPPLKKSKKK
jgi:hypothetical protein